MRRRPLIAALIALALTPLLIPRAPSQPVASASAHARKAAFRPSENALALLNRKADGKLTSAARRAGLTGWCGGLSFAALDYFAYGRPMPSSAELREMKKPLTPLNTYLFRRHLTSLADNGLTFVGWTLLPDATRGRIPGVGTLTREEELPELEEALRRGPVPLGLVRGRSLREVNRNHQVVAYEMQPLGRGLVLVRVYDPNMARAEDVALVFDAEDDSAPVWQIGGGRLLKVWRGFFVERYRPSPPPGQRQG